MGVKNPPQKPQLLHTYIIQHSFDQSIEILRLDINFVNTFMNFL